jgi:BlaI family penicillinase repressor
MPNLWKNLMKNKSPRISEGEWEIMNVIWSRTSCSAGETIEALRQTDASWHPRTVKTFLHRLVKKRLLSFSKRGRAYLYLPLVWREECVDAAIESFLRRVFTGSFQSMLAYFIQRGKLSSHEIRELRRLLKQPINTHR